MAPHLLEVAKATNRRTASPRTVAANPTAASTEASTQVSTEGMARTPTSLRSQAMVRPQLAATSRRMGSPTKALPLATARDLREATNRALRVATARERRAAIAKAHLADTTKAPRGDTPPHTVASSSSNISSMVAKTRRLTMEAPTE